MPALTFLLRVSVAMNERHITLPQTTPLAVSGRPAGAADSWIIAHLFHVVSCLGRGLQEDQSMLFGKLLPLLGGHSSAVLQTQIRDCQQRWPTPPLTLQLQGMHLL
jgi:hypothetical protein